MSRILVADGDCSAREAAMRILRDAAHEVVAVDRGDLALDAVAEGGFDLVLGDVALGVPGEFALLRACQVASTPIPVVMMSAGSSIEEAVEALRLGATDYLRKPFTHQELNAAVAKALEATGEAREPAARPTGNRNLAASSGILGDSLAIREAMDLLEKVAATDSTVLITGETGTGKELFGRAIHQWSRRRDKIFCAVNSAAFPETLLESELFGHRRGAFTGASSNKKGLIEHSHEGTLFLDEVAEMPLSMQAKLLRFLQTGEIRPVGGTHTHYVDVRLITASNKDLEAEVTAGRFREDLYYRLAVIPVNVPPLRDRVEDIPILAAAFLRRFSERLGKSVCSIEDGVMDRLAAYAWPGNVRQLENFVERAVALCRSNRVTMEELPPRMRENDLVRRGETIQSLQVVERTHILNTLDKVGWNRKRAAALLQISTTTLWRRLKEFGMDSGPERHAPPSFLGTRG